ncbi:hypothetical protein [Roseinatronobacter monicus]|uniref:hypothetical protein n=1 Tax=Roseinatronobacter monicus TaxID=393481 RepID=UPI0014777A59|nr:hypothetical protein [Roseinatronobacter monicus]
MIKLLSEPHQLRERGVLFLQVVLSSDELANIADGHEHSERVRSQGLEPVAFVKCPAARNAIRITAVKDIKHDDRDANGVGRNGDSPEGVDKQIAAKPAPVELLITPDHRDIGGGDVPMRRPGPRKLCRKIGKLNRVRIQSIEADDRAVSVNHNIEADVICLGELVCGLLKIVVDLLDTARKSRPIMPRRIERLNDIGSRS